MKVYLLIHRMWNGDIIICGYQNKRDAIVDRNTRNKKRTSMYDYVVKGVEVK